MSEADPDAVTVSKDGVTVRKTVDTEQFQTLTVVIELASEREDVTRIHLLDPLPDGVPIDEIGFHPEYGAEHWSVEDGCVVFERDLATGETYTTIYGIRDYPAEETAALLDEPDLELLEVGPESVDDVVDEGRSEVVRDFVAGEADLPGLEDELGAATETAEAAEETPVEDREVQEPPTGGVVQALVKELRERKVDPEDRQLLSEELLDTEGAVEARVTHLQQRVSDLEAYTDALEEFIDREGTAEKVISDFRDDVAGLEREVHATGDRVDDALERLSSVDDRVTEVETDFESLGSRVDHFGDRLGDIENDVAAVDDRADDLDGRIEDLRDELNTLRRNLRNDVQALEKDLEDFEEFQEQLSSVFGGAAGPGDEPGDVRD